MAWWRKHKASASNAKLRHEDWSALISRLRGAAYESGAIDVERLDDAWSRVAQRLRGTMAAISPNASTTNFSTGKSRAPEHEIRRIRFWDVDRFQAVRWQ
jgi:hypothetical protein